MQKKILLDTDIGTDIDDAFCLAYLLSQPRCELLGITTVSGEAEKRAMLASALCRRAQKDIPIYPGIVSPLLGNQLQPLANQFNRIGSWEYQKEYPNWEAVSFLQKTIRRYPGEITLLAIGPMTNIAVLFAVDPEIPELLKELVLMCGRFLNKTTNASLCEWNARCDPYAAAMVYNTPVKTHRSIGLDVTTKLVIKQDEMENRFSAGILAPVLDFVKEYFQKTDKMVFHDPLAAAVLFDESLCTYERGNVGVELKSDRLMGYTHWTKDMENGVHEVADTVDQHLFFKHYFGVINAFRC